MSDAATDFGVPVEPVWYEAPAVDEQPVDPAPAPVVATAPVAPVTPVDAPEPDDILPGADLPLIVEPPTEAPIAVEAQEPRAPRHWRTVPVAAALIAAVLIGFVLGRVTDSSGGSSNRSAPATTAEGTPQTPASSPGATGGTTAPGAVNGQALLLNIPRHTGPLITDHFTVTANRWVLGWAYDCTGQPGGTGTFNISVFDGSGSSSKDGGIDQQGAKGSSVVAYTSTGERYLSVTTTCVWAVRVTG